MRRFKKATAIMLVVAMMFSTVVGGNNAQASSAGAQSTEYTPIAVEEEKMVSITEGGQKVQFSFVPEESGVYIFQSRSAGYYCDTYANLYKETSSGMEHLTSNDDGGGNNNFVLSYSFVAGTTYILEAKAWNSSFVGEFYVSLIEPPIESVVIQPVSLIEHLGGNWSNQGTENEYYFYYSSSWMNSMEYAITMKNGDVVEGQGSSFEYNGYIYRFSYSEIQSSSSPWLKGNTYTQPVSVLGCDTAVDVAIIESPVNSIVIQPITILEHSNGYWNNQGTENEFYYYNNWCYKMDFEITLKNGQVITGDNTWGFYYNDIWMNFSWNDNQSNNHWTVGNTYTVPVSALGYETTVDITIIDTPVQSVVVEPVSILEKSGGYWNNQGTENEYYYYYWKNFMEYTVTMKDGSVHTVTNGNGIQYDGEWYYFTQEDNQDTNHWTAGNKYTAKAKILGYSVDVEVSIEETPVQSIVVQPISIIENSNGNWNQGPGSTEAFFVYNWYNKMDFVITMKNGEVITQENSTGFYYNNEWVGLWWSDNQWSDHWTVGNTYTVPVSALGCETTVEVAIIDTPVESIAIEPISLTEGTNGSYWNEGTQDEYFYYNWTNAIRNYTITMKDGSVHTVTTGNGMQYDGEWYYFTQEDNQDTNHWTAGNKYTAKAKILGYTADVEVTIAESPVESIVVEPIILAEHTDGYWNNYSGPGGSGEYYYYRWTNYLKYTITLKDGRVITGSGTSIWIDGEYYSYFSYNDPQYNEHWYAGNTYIVSLSCMGKKVDVSVSVYEKNQTDGYEYLVQDDSAIIIGCSKEDAVLNIPSVIDGYPVIGITDLTHAMDYVEELVIPDSVTMLSASLFEWNYDLKKLTIGKGISNIYNEMFIGATCLEEIVVSAENPYYISVDGVVYDKEGKTLVVFPRAKKGAYTVPDTVTDIDCLINNIAYYDVQLDLGNSQTDYVVEDGVIYNADKTVIYACDRSKTGKYVMPDTVTTINEGAFQKCSFSEVVVSENVSEIVYAAFSYSMELEKVVLPQNLKAIEWGAFSECEKLAEADLPSGLEILETSSFYKTGVTSVTVPGTVTEVGYGAYKESQVAELTLEDGIEVIWSDAFADTQLKSVVIPDSITHMGSGVFEDTPLESVTIGTGLEEISSSAFANTKLTTVTIPENIAEIWSYAFADSPLEEVIIERNDVYICEGAFYNCPLKEIDLKDGIVAISDYAFYGNQAESVIIPDSVTDVTYMSFAESKKLLNIDVPDDLESIDGTAFDGTAWWDAQADGVVYLENYLYGYKGKMPEGTEITVKDGTTLIANYAFNNEYSLKTLSIPSNLKNIGVCALDGCLSLEKVNVAEDNEWYFTNEEGTVLYDQYHNEIWRKVEKIFGDYIAWSGELVPYGMSLDDWLEEWPVDCVYVEYVDGMRGIQTSCVTADMVSGYDSMKPGWQTITIDFGRLSCEAEIYVEMPEITGIKVGKLPNKTVYDLNQELKTTGMVVNLVTENGTEFEIKDYEVSKLNSSEAGKKIVTVSYMDFEATFEVEVTGERITFVTETSSNDVGVQVSAPIESFEEGSQLIAEEKTIIEIEEEIEVPEIFKENTSQIFDIRFEKEEEVVQPAEGTTVAVSVPVPEGMDGRNSKIYHLTDEGEMVDMKAVYSEGRMVFDTTHFSYYGIVEVDGSSISGVVNYTNVTEGDVTVTLSKDNVVCDTVTAVDGCYNFVGLEDGTYTLKIEKTGHATREYEVIIGGESVEQDGQIRLIGDVNGDGKVNVSDVGKANAHAKKTSYLEGYEFACADVNGDGVINISDVGKMNAHAKKTLPLW